MERPQPPPPIDDPVLIIFTGVTRNQFSNWQEIIMKSIRKSVLALALPLALALSGTALTMLPTATPAFAEDITDDVWTLSYSFTDEDGNKHEVFQSNTDENKWVDLTYVGKNKSYTIYHTGDPGPDDSSKGSEPVDVVALIEAGLVTYKVRANPEDTPLGKWLTRDGSGAGPRINPGDEGDSKGPGSTPVVNRAGPTAAQIRSYIKAMNIAARELQQIGVAMGDVEGLSGEEAPSVTGHGNGRGNGSGKNNGDGPNPNGNGKNKYLGSGFDSLGPRPQFVNPPHSGSRSAAKAGSSGKSSSSSSAMNPGLLEGGSTFGSQGPSAAGSPVGSSSRGSPSAAGIR
jgi:hypothetical protein